MRLWVWPPGPFSLTITAPRIPPSARFQRLDIGVSGTVLTKMAVETFFGAFAGMGLLGLSSAAMADKQKKQDNYVRLLNKGPSTRAAQACQSGCKCTGLNCNSGRPNYEVYQVTSIPDQTLHSPAYASIEAGVRPQAKEFVASLQRAPVMPYDIFAQNGG